MENDYRKRAEKLHRKMRVVDAHLDLPGEILYRKNNGEHDIIEKYYLKDWEQAGVRLVVASVFVESMLLPEMGLRNVLNQITALKEEIKNLNEKHDKIKIVTSRDELNDGILNGKIGIIIYVEGLDFIGNDMSLLDVMYELGVRGAALTWSRPNLLACGCCRASENEKCPGGLTNLGLKAVERLEKLGMFVDVSHINDDGFEDISNATKRPFVATHSCSRKVYAHYRNLTDDQLVKIAQAGGMVGINGCRLITGVKNGEDAIEKLCEHTEYICGLIGAEYVGLGMDFCDSYDCARFRRSVLESYDDSLTGYGQLVEFTERLMTRGMCEKDVAGIIGNNFINYFRKILS